MSGSLRVPRLPWPPPPPPPCWLPPRSRPRRRRLRRLPPSSSSVRLPPWLRLAPPWLRSLRSWFRLSWLRLSWLRLPPPWFCGRCRGCPAVVRSVVLVAVVLVPLCRCGCPGCGCRRPGSGPPSWVPCGRRSRRPAGRPLAVVLLPVVLLPSFFCSSFCCPSSCCRSSRLSSALSERLGPSLGSLGSRGRLVRALLGVASRSLSRLLLWPPPWAVLMASMRAPLRIPVALMPSPPASCLSSGSNMAFRPPLRAPDASAPVAGAVSVVWFIRGPSPLSAVRRGPPAELLRWCRYLGDSGHTSVGFQEGVGVGASPFVGSGVCLAEAGREALSH